MLLLFLPLFLFSYFVDFSDCYKKYSFIKDYIPISSSVSVKISDKNRNCFLYDNFTKLCFFKSNNSKTVTLYPKYNLGSWAASIKDGEVYVGNFVKHSTFLNYTPLSSKVIKNSVISDMFCRVVGIGSGSFEFLESKLINHFFKYRYWGDVGLVVDRNLRVVAYDPYYVSGFKIGEKIETINYKKASLSLWQDVILLGRLGKEVYINSKPIKIRKKIYEFSPLSYFGITLHKNLTLSFSKKLKNRYFIEDGAKLIYINDKKIDSYLQALQILSLNKDAIITVDFDGIYLEIPLKR